jgi:predicted ester cyclase
MGGCIIKPLPCTKPMPARLDHAEEKSIAIVRDFIQRVWNYTWTPEENNELRKHRGSKGSAYVPPKVEAALHELLSPGVTRHRRDAKDGPIYCTGADDYSSCVSAVQAIAPDLRIEILDIVADGDRVVTNLSVEGTDRSVDGRTDVEGAFGVFPPTGNAFRVEAAMMFRLAAGRIEEDWLLYKGRRS